MGDSKVDRSVERGRDLTLKPRRGVKNEKSDRTRTLTSTGVIPSPHTPSAAPHTCLYPCPTANSIVAPGVSLPIFHLPARHVTGIPSFSGASHSRSTHVKMPKGGVERRQVELKGVEVCRD